MWRDLSLRGKLVLTGIALQLGVFALVSGSVYVLVGRFREVLQHNLEIRGVGVIDVQAIFGIRGIRMQKRIEVEVNGLSVPFISLVDLIKNKLATGRGKDRVDAETLQKRTNP